MLDEQIANFEFFHVFPTFVPAHTHLTSFVQLCFRRDFFSIKISVVWYNMIGWEYGLAS